MGAEHLLIFIITIIDYEFLKNRLQNWLQYGKLNVVLAELLGTQLNSDTTHKTTLGTIFICETIA